MDNDTYSVRVPFSTLSCNGLSTARSIQLVTKAALGVSTFRVTQYIVFPCLNSVGRRPMCGSANFLVANPAMPASAPFVALVGKSVNVELKMTLFYSRGVVTPISEIDFQRFTWSVSLNSASVRFVRLERFALWVNSRFVSASIRSVIVTLVKSSSEQDFFVRTCIPFSFK